MGIFLLLFSLTLFWGDSEAVDLEGCAPGGPKIITAGYNVRGIIESPGFKENQYPNMKQCVYSIRAPFGHRIRLTFKHFDIDPFDLCMKDKLIIHEGPDPRGPVHGVFCGNETPKDLLSLGNSLTLVFITDFLTGRKGFQIEYSVSLGQLLCPLGQSLCRNGNCYSLLNRCNGQDDCGDGSDEENCKHPLPVTQCGVTPIEPVIGDAAERIIGGRPAVPGSWPWQVDLQLVMFKPSHGHMCGGTLINAEWVLSAAHCFQRNGRVHEWRIHLGNYNKFKKDPYEQVRYPKRIIVYPGYTGDQELVKGRLDMINDIALVKLNAPVKFSDHVKPACLPVQNQELQSGTECMATGWGMTRGTGYNDVLKQVSLAVQAGNKCINPHVPFVPKSMICVRNSKGFQDVCHGDSGGPLACKIRNAWYLMGATSYGTVTNFMGGACSLPGSHTVYTKVSDKIQWIERMIQQYNN